jgi:hypothetical protein
MCMTFSAMVAWFFLVQDAPSVQDLVTKLGHEDIEQRERALKELIRRSESAIPPLLAALASEDLEVVERAKLALSQIQQRVQLRPVYRERFPFTIDLRGISVEKALEAISQQSHVTFRVNSSISQRVVNLKMTEGTLLESLDRLCRGLGDVQWYYVDQDVIALQSQPPIRKPSAYTDCFRISLKKIETLRTSNFAEGTGCVALFLEADVEQGIKYLGVPVFSIAEVVDDNGNTLSEWVHPAAGIDLKVGQAVLIQTEPPRAESQPFCFAGIGSSARSLRRVRGAASFFFSRGSEEFVLDDLAKKELWEVGDCRIRILENTGGILKLGLSRKDQPIELTYFEMASVVITDEEGGEHPLTPPDCEGYHLPQDHTTVLTFFFDRAWKMRATRAAFRMTRGVQEIKVPFEFREVPLP